MSDPSTGQVTEIDLAEIPGSTLTVRPSSRFHRFRDWLSDCFSSIMVKEARQSLKSHQFFITYTIVIFAVASWTVLMFFSEVTNVRGDSEQLSEALFYGYCMILGVPLCLVVPFSAFRSLAREYEDGTIQLISITTMKPYQIVLGKLGTALLQMVIYLSVIAPCIALTYMLDAISYPLIALVLAIAIGGSIFLTIFGLLLAGASRSYTLSMGISVFFVLGLGGLYLGWWNLLDEMLTGYGFNANYFLRPEEQISVYGLVSFLGSTALMMLTAAGAQISFESDNRSTATRIATLVQLTMFLGLMVMILIVTPGASEVVFFVSAFAGHFWLIMGCMFVSERPGLSDRVRRTLPKTWLGRSCCSFLMPGPGRGYLFAVSGLVASVTSTFVIVAASVHVDIFKRILENARFGMGGAINYGSFKPNIDWTEVIATSGVACLYPLFFLSLVYLWMSLLRRYTRMNGTGALAPFIGLLSGVFFVSAISIAAYTLWYKFEVSAGRDYYSAELGFFGCFNWYQGMEHLGDHLFGGGRSGLTNLWPGMVYFVPFAAVAIATIMAAFLLAIRELRYQPTAAPVRVTEEIKRDRAERLSRASAPAGESIDEIFGVLPDKKESNKGK